MQCHQFDTAKLLGKHAAQQAISSIQAVLKIRSSAHIILATGASQFEMLAHLIQAEGIDWSRVVAFHLDEYLNLASSHPASFRKYLKDRFVDQLPTLGAFHYIRGDAPDPVLECKRVGAILQQHPIDVAMIGIGENGHLAFNDPPADVVTEEPYIVVELDQACRKQQLGEGWFPDLASVPTHAISMSMQQILKSTQLIVSVPDARKAVAVQQAVEGPLTPHCPASFLQQHSNCMLYLDNYSASLLS
ncbi:MAG: glucosamine-6-phosphate deaminase [Bacteroidota bacterium]